MGLTKDKRSFYFEHISAACTGALAHRSSFYAICLLSEGEMIVETNLFMNHAKAPSFFVIAPDVIRRFFETENKLKASVLFFDKEYFLKNQASIHFLDKFDFFVQKDRHIIELDDLQHQKFLNYFLQIEQKINENKPHTPDIIRSFIYIILNELDDITSSMSNAMPNYANRGEQLLLEYKTLLTKHFVDQRQLAFYAEKLHVTP